MSVDVERGRWKNSSELNAAFELAALGYRHISDHLIARALVERRERRQNVWSRSEIPSSFAGWKARSQ